MSVAATAKAPSPEPGPASASAPAAGAGAGAGIKRARTASDAHIALYRERMRRSWVLISTPSSSGRGFVRGKRPMRASSADAWWAPRLKGKKRGRKKKKKRKLDQRWPSRAFGRGSGEVG
jgi:hypothetical protein